MPPEVLCYLLKFVLAGLVALLLVIAAPGRSGSPARGREALLLAVLTVTVAVGVYALHRSGAGGASNALWSGGALLLLLMWGLHVFLRIVKSAASESLLPLAALLTCLGWLEIARIDPALAHKQLVWAALSAAVFIGAYLLMRDYSILEDYRYLILTTGIALQLLVMLFGREVNGARLWFHLGLFNFQPVEVVKLFLVVFLAAYLRQFRRYLSLPFFSRDFALPLQGFIPILLMWGLCEGILVVQKDLGMALLFFGVFITLFFFATGRREMVAAGLLLLGGGFFLSYHLFSHVRARIAVWLSPWGDAHGGGYQIVQALISAASGGVWGTGLGCGTPGVIPAVTTDMITMALYEEAGLAMALLVIAAFVLVFREMFVVAARCRKEFGALLAGGFALILAIQALIIICGNFTLIPLTGLTLPFVSYGGSSLLSNFLLLGLVMRIASSPSSPDAAPQPEKERFLIGALSVTMMALFAVPAVWAIWFSAFPAESLRANPLNTRLRENLALRGRIVDRKARVLARTEARGGAVLRVFPEGAACGAVVGYDDPRYGLAGIEASQNRTLTGRKRPATFGDALWLMRHGTLKGHDVTLTLDAELQARAYALLEGKRGAIIAMTVEGEILAATTSPSFDPGRLGGQWDELKARSDAPLLDRAFNGLYPPGSTFKILTLAAGLESGAFQQDDTFPCTGSYAIGSYRVRDAARASHGTVTALDALVSSCNIAFAQMGLKITAPVMEDYARKFRLADSFDPGVPTSRGLFPPVEKLTDTHLAQCAFGQGEVLVTPLHMALVTSVFACRGRMPEPRLLKEGKTSSSFVMSPVVAEKVRTAMVDVVARGTGSAAQIRGVAVAGKTGTAENPHGEPHAWFTCFAPAERPRIVVTVIVEEGGYGGRAAAPLAAELLSRCLREYR